MIKTILVVAALILSANAHSESPCDNNLAAKLALEKNLALMSKLTKDAEHSNPVDKHRYMNMVGGLERANENIVEACVEANAQPCKL
jgi:hypothetical protein